MFCNLCLIKVLKFKKTWFSFCVVATYILSLNANHQPYKYRPFRIPKGEKHPANNNKYL